MKSPIPIGALVACILLFVPLDASAQSLCVTSDASASVYDDSWQSGDNDGSGFGPWELSKTSTDPSKNGFFVFTSTNNNGDGDTNGDGDIDTSGRALGLYANSLNEATATRPFTFPLVVGERFVIELDHGLVDCCNGQVGFELQNSLGETLLAFSYFPNVIEFVYVTLDESGYRSIPLTITDEGLQIEIQLDTPSTYEMSILFLDTGDSVVKSGALINPPGGQSVDAVNIFNTTAGVDASHDLYVNGFQKCYQRGDFDGDGLLTCADWFMLLNAANSGNGALFMDLNLDGIVDVSDVPIWTTICEASDSCDVTDSCGDYSPLLGLGLGVYDCIDVGLLNSAITGGSTDLSYDISRDGFVNGADLDAWDDYCNATTTCTIAGWLTCDMLPVTLTAFSARVEGGDVHLEWSVENETGGLGYAVEHQTPGSSFIEIGFVESSGESSKSTQYRFTAHDLAPGTHRFRLKQIDLDGGFTYSEEVEVSVELPQSISVLEITPNPFSLSTTAIFAVQAEQQIRVSLHDIQGRRIRDIGELTALPQQQQQIEIASDNLSPGVYLLRLDGPFFRASELITVIR